jgi:hypothetical protein
MTFVDTDTKAGTRNLFEPYVATMNSNVGSGSFVAQYKNYDPSGTQVCSLPGSATEYIGGIATDTSGDLYVPQSSGQGTAITEYGPHCGSVVNTLTYSAGNQPQDVAVDGNTVYAVDSSYRNPSVQVFANGSTTPTGTLSDPSIYQNYDLAVDANHDLFLSYYSSTTGSNSVIEFPGGTAPGTILPMTGGIGLLADNANNLLYITPNQANWEISTYAPPYTGSPVQTITLKSNAQRGPTYCSLNKANSRIFCGDTAYMSLDVYKYPAGSYVYSLLLPYSPYSLTYSVANAPAR